MCIQYNFTEWESRVTYKLQNAEEGVYMPSLVGCEALCCQTDLGSHPQLELVVGNLEECKEFTNENSNIAFVD